MQRSLVLSQIYERDLGADHSLTTQSRQLLASLQDASPSRPAILGLSEAGPNAQDDTISSPVMRWTGRIAGRGPIRAPGLGHMCLDDGESPSIEVGAENQARGLPGVPAQLGHRRETNTTVEPSLSGIRHEVAPP